MNETPLPLIVCAIRTPGVPSSSRQSVRKASRSAPWSCPSQVTTRQPNATQLRLEALEREDLLGRLVRLELVAVDDDEQPPDPLVRRRLERLPVLAFLQLAVARHHDDAAAAAEMALRPRDPARLGDPHPERAGVRLDPGDADVGVPVEPPEPRAGAAGARSGRTPNALRAA